jgi:hypothetical protein
MLIPKFKRFSIIAFFVTSDVPSFCSKELNITPYKVYKGEHTTPNLITFIDDNRVVQAIHLVDCHDPSTLCEVRKANEKAQEDLTGGSSTYYKMKLTHNTTPELPDDWVECNDIIETLKMTFAEGNIFKAVWRIASSRLGNGKKNHKALYDAQKIVFFGKNMIQCLEREKGSDNKA